MFTAERMNQKTVFSGTGAQIAAIGTTYAGMLAFCTSTGSGFKDGLFYIRNPANTGWLVPMQELGRTALGGAGSTITVDNLPAVKVLRIVVLIKGSSASITPEVTFNNDTGWNYNFRATYADIDGGSVGISDSKIPLAAQVNGGREVFAVIEIMNFSDVRKQVIIHSLPQTGAPPSYPDINDVNGNWGNVSDQITRVDIKTPIGTFNAGSEVIVYGGD